jgi:spore maturation protein CgeB
MKKLLYVYQNYTNDYSSASLSILRSFKKSNVIHVEEFEFKPLSFNKKINRLLNRLPILKAFHFKKQNKTLETFIAKDDYDFLFVMKGTDLKVSMLRTIKDKNKDLKLICFNPDDPFNKASSNLDIVSSIPLYDYYCIWTKLLNDRLRKEGAKEILYLPFGIDSTIIYPIETLYQYDISFIGNGDSERHRLIKELNDEITKRGLIFKVHVFGNNWPFMGKNIFVHGQINGIDFLKTISASRINLNLLRRQNKNSINMRTFEIPGANGFMIHEESEEAKTFFTEDNEVIYFSSIKDLVDKCEFYLKNEVELVQIRKNCMEKISKLDYSYEKFIKNELFFLWEE